MTLLMFGAIDGVVIGIADGRTSWFAKVSDTTVKALHYPSDISGSAVAAASVSAVLLVQGRADFEIKGCRVLILDLIKEALEGGGVEVFTSVMALGEWLWTNVLTTAVWHCPRCEEARQWLVDMHEGDLADEEMVCPEHDAFSLVVAGCGGDDVTATPSVYLRTWASEQGPRLTPLADRLLKFWPAGPDVEVPSTVILANELFDEGCGIRDAFEREAQKRNREHHKSIAEDNEAEADKLRRDARLKLERLNLDSSLGTSERLHLAEAVEEELQSDLSTMLGHTELSPIGGQALGVAVRADGSLLTSSTWRLEVE